MAPVVVFLFGTATGIVMTKAFPPLLKNSQVIGAKAQRKIIEVKEGIKEDMEDLMQRIKYGIENRDES